ncbi:MAG: hypothetical protein EAZ97_08765 [Bacteroidetes bacterium]|nr:MAG: hypothetical protein EAZ97_08765 [Bacteroidota bacterium]
MGIFFSYSLQAQSVLQKGILDLRTWDFDQKPILKIEGESHFEYNKFLEYADIQALKKPHFIKIPSNWKDFSSDDMPLKGQGFATYSFQILLPKKRPENLVFHIPEQSVAYKLYINGKKSLEIGKLDSTAEKNQMQVLPIILELPTADTLQIVFHAAQFSLREGGLRAAILLGEAQEIRRDREKKILFDVFLTGATFIMSCYHFGLFFLRKKDKSSLIFAIICLLTLLRTLVTGEQVLAQLFVEWSWHFDLLKMVAYLTFYGLLMALTSFVQSVFPEDISQKVLRFIQIISVICMLATVFLPIQISNQIIPFYQIFALLVVIYYLVMIGIIVFRKRPDSKIILLGILIICIATINDILYFKLILDKTILLFGIGLFIFLFLQAFLLASRFSAAFGQIENLSGELRNLNQNLEQKVESRTQEINQKNNELNMTIEELHSTLDIVSSQKREIELQQDNLLLAKQQIQEKTQNLLSSIQYAKRIQSSMLADKALMKSFFSDYFILYRPKDVVSGDFYWFKQIDEHRGIVTVSDCTGHGVPGALMSMLGIEILNKIVDDKNIHEPAQILTALHQNIRRTLRQEQTDNTEGMEMGILLLDKQSRQIVYAGAMNPMYYVENQEIIDVRTAKKSIGGHLTNEKKDFEQQSIQLSNNPVMLYLCSDGYQDQFGGQNKRKFMIKKLKSLFVELANLPLKSQKTRLENTLIHWMKEANEKQTDDVTVMGIRF